MDKKGVGKKRQKCSYAREIQEAFRGEMRSESCLKNRLGIRYGLIASQFTFSSQHGEFFLFLISHTASMKPSLPLESSL